MDDNILSIYSDEELNEMKKAKMLENLELITDKNIFDLNTTKKYKELIVNCKTIEELNNVEKEMSENKNLQIRKKSFINYIVDYNDNHMITNVTKDVCIDAILDVVTMEELEQIEVELEKILRRLENGEPVQYILGVADFAGRQFHVAPGVLIPRPETAELCGWVVSEAKRASQLLDIGTGSGCIAVTLAAELPHAKVSAWDISDDALRIAQENATRQGVNVTFEKHDILDANPTFGQTTYDIIVSNPPYIKPSERDGMAKNVLDYEPDIALFAPDENPVIFYQRIADFAWQNLTNGGKLFFELNPLTAETVGDYLHQLGFAKMEFRRDIYGKQRFLKAIKL